MVSTTCPLLKVWNWDLTIYIYSSFLIYNFKVRENSEKILKLQSFKNLKLLNDTIYAFSQIFSYFKISDLNIYTHTYQYHRIESWYVSTSRTCKANSIWSILELSVNAHTIPHPHKRIHVLTFSRLEHDFE